MVVLEGKLIAPWVTELEKTWAALAADLGGRELVIDMANLTAVSAEGENVLLELMRRGARFRCRGVFTKHIVQQLALRHKRSAGNQLPNPCADSEEGEHQE